MLRLLLFIMLILPSPVWAGEWISLPTPSGEAKAYLALPDGQGPFPGVAYNHGTAVRQMGFKKAARKGYDVTAFADALAAEGFVALASVRSHLSKDSYAAAVKKGRGVAHAALDFLASHPDVTPNRIGMIGFSEGGLVSLWAAVKREKLAALVLMSPATIKEAGDWQLKAAARRDVLADLKVPVLLTMGTQDNRSIIKLVHKRLIPNMEKLGLDLTIKDTYGGDHKWFWKPRAAYFDDVLAFLVERLKER